VIAAAMMVGGVLDRAWEKRHSFHRVRTGGARRRAAAPPKPMTARPNAAEIERSDARPSYSHPNAGRRHQLAPASGSPRKEELALARYFYNEARSHIAWTVRINRTTR